jgi:thiol-disulfide isomerase/thioredoxin
MTSGGKKNLDVLKGLSAPDAAYRRQLSQRFDDQKKAPAGMGAGTQADQFKLVTHKALDLYGSDPSQGLRLSPFHVAQGPKTVHGMTVIDYWSAPKLVTGDAVVLVADPADPKLAECVNNLRVKHRDHTLFLVEDTKDTKPASIVVLFMKLRVNKKLVQERGPRDYFFFKDGDFRGRFSCEAKPPLAPVAPKTKADEEELPVAPLVPRPMTFPIITFGDRKQIKREIVRGSYPVMVVLTMVKGGQECSECAKFKQDLIKAQESGKWGYHLVFIERLGPVPHRLMKELNILEVAAHIGQVPQVYVFKGKLEPEAPPGGMAAYVESVKERGAAITGGAVKAPSAEKVVEVPPPLKAEEERKTVVVITKDKADKAKKPPAGFLELRRREDLKQAIREIRRAAYPGSEAEISRQFREDLLQEQQGGKWENHRLVFLNVHTGQAPGMMKRLGIWEFAQVKKIGEHVHEVYIFEKGRLSQSIRWIAPERKEAVQAQKTPMGFRYVNRNNFEDVKQEILKNDYPVMVMVGRRAEKCPFCAELKEDLLQAQLGSSWEGHRLVYIDLDTQREFVKQLNIRKVKFVPRVYVFKGELKPILPEGGSTEEHMSDFAKRIDAMAKEVEKAMNKKRKR